MQLLTHAPPPRLVQCDIEWVPARQHTSGCDAGDDAPPEEAAHETLPEDARHHPPRMGSQGDKYFGQRQLPDPNP